MAPDDSDGPEHSDDEVHAEQDEHLEDPETDPSEDPGDEEAEDATPARAGTSRRSLSDRITEAVYRPRPRSSGRAQTGAGDDDIEEPEPGGRTQMTDAEKAAAIRQVDPTERKVGYIGAALITAIAGVYFLPYVSNPKKQLVVPRSGKTCPSGFRDELIDKVHQCTIVYTRTHWITEFVIVLLFAAFILVAARVGRRSLLAFAFLFSGLAVETTTGTIIGLGFLVAGGWLLVRAYRVQKYGTTNSKEVAKLAAEKRGDRSKPGGSTAKSGRTEKSASGRTTATARSTKRGKGAQADPAPSGRAKPQASKRYTPKAPPRKKPPPPE